MDDAPHEKDAPGALIVWEPDTILGRRYVLERQLGRGSNGNVWLARDQLLAKSVALKALDPELAKNRDTVRRFLREVALAHAVTHPHVVRIYDTGEEDGLPFFTMEYIKGQTLEERIDEMLEQKLELAETIIGAGEEWLTELSTSELREMLRLRPADVEEATV